MSLTLPAPFRNTLRILATLLVCAAICSAASPFLFNACVVSLAAFFVICGSTQANDMDDRAEWNHDFKVCGRENVTGFSYSGYVLYRIIVSQNKVSSVK